MEGIVPLPAGGCLRCAQIFPTTEATLDGGVCARCRREPPAYDRLLAYGSYAGPLRRAVQLLKYRGVESLGDRLGRLSAGTYRQHGVEADCIVAAPLHWNRRRERGFNQAELLARPLAAETGLPLVRALVRVRPTVPQAGLTRKQRTTNLRGAFRARSRVGVRDKRIVVVDDVATTGATFEACARALKRAGAAEVTGLAIARAHAEIRG